MERIIAKIAGLGVPALVLMAAINATGLAGAAAITVSLSALGPGGMVGGAITLCATGLIMDAITEFGFSAIYSGVIKQLFVNGETKESIVAKIKRYPISKKLKAKLMADVNRF